MEASKLTYTANAGVMITIDGKKLLIDALNSSVHPLYKRTPEDIAEKLINGIPPYDSITAVLITHSHLDHFDEKKVAELLDKSPDTVVVSTSEVISIIREQLKVKDDSRLISLSPNRQESTRLELQGIGITAFALTHEGNIDNNIDNLAFLIEGSKNILHLGDAAPIRENYVTLELPQLELDLLIANFPYISLPAGRNIISEYIKPKKIAIVHLPHEEEDRFGWISIAKKSYERVKDNFIETRFLEILGEEMDI
jgi:L-ascorbate metabolism protein UlaG (beta-lactamase superfamily)